MNLYARIDFIRFDWDRSRLLNLTYFKSIWMCDRQCSKHTSLLSIIVFFPTNIARFGLWLNFQSINFKGNGFYGFNWGLWGAVRRRDERGLHHLITFLSLYMDNIASFARTYRNECWEMCRPSFEGVHIRCGCWLEYRQFTPRGICWINIIQMKEKQNSLFTHWIILKVI